MGQKSKNINPSPQTPPPPNPLLEKPQQKKLLLETSSRTTVIYPHLYTRKFWNYTAFSLMEHKSFPQKCINRPIGLTLLIVKETMIDQHLDVYSIAIYF